MQPAKLLGIGLFFTLLTACGAAHEDNELSAAATGYDRCPDGNICFFTEKNGGGKVCKWTDFDEDWASGGTVCSWATTTNVASVWNRTDYRIQYYKKAHYEDRVGSTVSGGKGDLAGTYKLRSHKTY